MQPADFANVSPLIAEQRVHHRRAEFTFRCPVSGQEIRASATLPRPSELPALAAQLGRSSLIRAVRDALFHTISRMFGHGFFGRFLGELARGAIDSAQHSRGELSAAEVERAAVLAFEQVARRFAWDPSGRRWISRASAEEVLSDFDRALADAPVDHHYDRGVLARMLVQVARADGRVTGEEASWLTQYIAASEGSIEGLGARPPLTRAELEETSRPVRANLLMLAWAVAMVDEEFSAQERALLESFARGLGLSQRERDHAVLAARAFVLEQALERMVTWGGHDEYARDELNAMAERMGVAREETERIEARYLRRMRASK